MPAGLGTLFAGLLLIVLAFVEGSSVWKSLHEVLFGLFGCGSFVLGAAVCYLAILYTRGEDLLGQAFKLLLGLIFASGTVIVFSDIPADIPAARMVAECYQNGVTAWLGGGALGALLGGNLLLLCGRPAANLVMVVLALCASLYIFDITPAELWQWVCELGGGVHERAWPSTSRTPPAAPSGPQPVRLRRKLLRWKPERNRKRPTTGRNRPVLRPPAGCPAFSAGATR